MFDEFFSVQRERLAQFHRQLVAEPGASINSPLLTAIACTQLAAHSVHELMGVSASMLARRYAAIETVSGHHLTRMADTSRQLRALREQSPPPAVEVLFAEVARVGAFVGEARAHLLIENYRLWDALHHGWLRHCLGVYVTTFRGHAMEGLTERLKAAAADVTLTTAEAVAEATFVPLVARIVRALSGLRPPLLEHYPSAAAWHRELDAYIEASLQYAAFVDYFIQVAEVAGRDDSPADADSWEPAEPWTRVMARYGRILDGATSG
jgi:hypothetical protein